MTFNLTVSPDFAPDHIAGWYFFNTWLQRQLGNAVHLELYDSFEQQRQDLRADKLDLIYANPYDASMLVRELGFEAIARPLAQPDETIIACREDADFESVEDLQPGTRVATTSDPDVHTMGMIMLEPADLDSSNISIAQRSNYVLVAKSLLKREADIGFFLKAGYQDLSALIQNQMKVLVTSQISVVHHTLLVGPRMREQIPLLQERLLAMHEDDKGRSVLESLGIEQWESMDRERTEFMIDLIDTLIP
ncbi:phosphate/phosphite/phosphonate ABC transporter substrate-binding protein [Motiliproteus sp.]|uniref:phosphate/phosphite/phosphonate ABC transporter substrate-binding protein n=1 Tax=Motiliproteus sp. TaxID=1898955 RepID=UPI003BA98182